MDTKWKRSRKVISMLGWALGVSTLAVCAVANPVRVCGGLQEAIAAADPEGSYEQSAWFRSEVEEMLDGLIRIGAGQPVLYSGAAVETTVTMEDAAQETASAEEGAASAGEILTETFGGWTSVVSATAIAGDGTAEEAEREWTPEEIKRSAELFLEQRRSDKNILFELKQDGEVLYDNLDGQVIGGAGNELPPQYDFLLKFDGEKAVILMDGVEQDVYGDGVYTADGTRWRIPGYENYRLPDDWKKSEITLAVRAEPVQYVGEDVIYSGTLYYIWQNFQWNRRYILGYCAALAAALLCLIPAFVWRKSRREARMAIGAVLGKVPGELRLAVLGCLIWMEALYWRNGGGDGIGDAVFVLAALWALWLAVTDVRFGRKLFESSFLCRLLRFLQVKEGRLGIGERMERQFNRPFLLSLAVPVLLLGIICCLSDRVQWAVLFMILLAVDAAALIGTLFFSAKSQKRLAANLVAADDCIRQICEGGQPDASVLPADPELADLVQRVAELSDGLETAVEERLKSERMKVELVTNVSHDIKTPLTSIISYVDLLKQAEELPEELRDYVKILSAKSERLREIVQDVFELSRAASGQLPLKMERLDLGKLLRQTLADRKDTIEETSFQLRVNLPEEEVMVLADGQRMYRVFANLIENALKYSLEGSRIFLTLKKEDGKAEVRIQNTSKEELKEGKDFTERFVRGDESRTDGGSGLGLSIAKSFTEACGGDFHVETAGDSFTVIVAFQEDGER